MVFQVFQDQMACRECPVFRGRKVPREGREQKDRLVTRDHKECWVQITRSKTPADILKSIFSTKIGLFALFLPEFFQNCAKIDFFRLFLTNEWYFRWKIAQFKSFLPKPTSHSKLLLTLKLPIFYMCAMAWQKKLKKRVFCHIGATKI